MAAGSTVCDGRSNISPKFFSQSPSFLRASSLPCGREATEAAPFAVAAVTGVELGERRWRQQQGAGRRRGGSPRGGAVDGRRVDAGEWWGRIAASRTYNRNYASFPHGTTVHAKRRRGNQVSR